jgi:hypothetical protein
LADEFVEALKRVVEELEPVLRHDFCRSDARGVFLVSGRGRCHSCGVDFGDRFGLCPFEQHLERAVPVLQRSSNQELAEVLGRHLERDGDVLEP